ncbi:S1 family peptidase [Symbioplanes lichenis]|uniref:S1 family peptidase n=1 Tax=Symbioplanes lichenis TaxID=1629072 RepID=UPI0027389FC4|nr:trypsin-like serine protease [Actinoplanes lichenis]
MLLTAASALLPAARPAAAIAYGEDVTDGGYPFTVLLTMTGLPATDGGTRDSSCSGALIAPRWVITAGHCFKDEDERRVDRTVADRTTAVVGRTDLTGGGGQEAEVDAVHQAEDSDVALARLDRPITGVPLVAPATEPPAAGATLRLTGYGLTADGAPATRLQTGVFTVDAVGDTLLETSGREPRPDTSPCPHDSGGPYVAERPGGAPVLVAVVSTGPRCPHEGPDLSARVDVLHDWITGTMSSSHVSHLPLVLLIAAVVAVLMLGGFAWRRKAACGQLPPVDNSGARRGPA